MSLNEYPSTELILIRHASTTRQPGRDCLTDLGNKHAVRLPKLLEENGHKIDAVFYVSEDKNGRKIKRCCNTIKELECDSFPKKWNGFPFNKLIDYSGKTVAICYIKQSLRRFPDFHCDILADSSDKSKTDLLYENIIVLKYNDSNYECIKVIKTDDKSIEKQER